MMMEERIREKRLNIPSISNINTNQRREGEAVQSKVRLKNIIQAKV